MHFKSYRSPDGDGAIPRGSRGSQHWHGGATRRNQGVNASLEEVTAQIARAQEMQRMLGALLNCPCDTLEECVRPRLVVLARKQSRHVS